MPIIQPYKGLSIDRLVALANDTNSTNHGLPEDFTLGPPTAVAASEGRNTQVEVYPADTERYRRQQLNYRRLSLSVLNNLPTGEIVPVVIRVFPFTIHEILDEINAALGLDLTPGEVQDTAYNIVQPTYRLSIATNTSSYAWVQSHYDFAVSFEIEGARYTEDGLLRLTEDGQVRYLAEYVPMA